MNWTGVTEQQPTNATKKLPKDYEEQKKVMAQRCAYLVECS